MGKSGETRMLLDHLGGQFIEFDQPFWDVVAELGKTGQGVHADVGGGGKGSGSQDWER